MKEMERLNSEGKRGRAVIFARVSTDKQDLTEQVARMTRVALADGYSRDSIEVIQHKESGISLREDEREGLNSLRQALDGDSGIETVYVFEISRLARRMDVMASLVQWFQDKGVQLVCDTPSVRLFERDGRVSLGGQMMIYLMGVMAEQEMKVKKERFANGKRRSREMGRWNGGTPLFGFRIEDKREVVDGVKAGIILKAYALYAQDENRTAHTNREIARLLQASCPRTERAFSASRVARFISTEKYRGAIVPPELWDRCQEIRERNRHGSRERLMSLGERLVRCPFCGRNYRKVGNSYICAGHKDEYRGTELYCRNSATISAKWLDWTLSETCAAWWLDEASDEERGLEERLGRERVEISGRLSALDGERRKLDEKKKRLRGAYLTLAVTQDEFSRAWRKLEKEGERLEDDRRKLMERMSDLELEGKGGNPSQPALSGWSELWQGGWERMSHAELYEAVHRLVDRVEVEVRGGEKWWTIWRKEKGEGKGEGKKSESESQTYMCKGHGKGVCLFGEIGGFLRRLM